MFMKVLFILTQSGTIFKYRSSWHAPHWTASWEMPACVFHSEAFLSEGIINLKKNIHFPLREMSERMTEDRPNTQKKIEQWSEFWAFAEIEGKIGSTSERHGQHKAEFLTSRLDVSCRLAYSLLPMHFLEAFIKVLSSISNILQGRRQLGLEHFKTQFIRACCHHNI